ncbi:unnamed protein product, partial [Meganyctiphanes norvegica]
MSQKEDRHGISPNDLGKIIDNDNIKIDETHGLEDKKTYEYIQIKKENCSKNDTLRTCKMKVRQSIKANTGKRPYQCIQCDKVFAHKSIFIRHMRTHTGERLFQCSECEKAFTLKSDLVGHMKTHTGERPFKCTQCERAFLQNTNLASHMRIHTGE